MPREITESSASTRRSSRLKNKRVLTDVEQAVPTPDELPKAKRRKVNNHKSIDQAHDEKGEPSSVAQARSSRNPRRSLRISPSELVRRESDLLVGENDLKTRSDHLDRRILSHSKREDEAARIMSQIAEREAQATLDQLEEYFNCPLCYEIMATPYSLNSAVCGHTFCGLCILKWFFSRLHVPCGGWHEQVDCPICRSMITTPEGSHRTILTFPFVPNRIVTTVVTSLVEKLSLPPANTAMKVKREELEGVGVLISGSKGDRGRKCVWKEKAKEEEDGKSKTSDVAAWQEGGMMRAEWLKKDKEGKREMGQLLESWSTLRSHDWIQLKQKFGV